MGSKVAQEGHGDSRAPLAEGSEDPLESSFCASLLSFAFFSALLPLLGPFWYYFGLMLEPLGPQKHSIFIKMVIKFKLFTIFASDIALGPKNHPKTL